VVSHEQLIHLGLGRGAIKHHVASGRLHRLFVGVYAVGHARVPPPGWETAAVLACGPGAVLSHHNAGERWNLLRHSNRAIHVTVPGKRRRSRDRITVHRVRALDPRDVANRDGLPVTALPRTLLDLAEVLERHRLDRVVEEAERQQKLDLREIEELIGRSPGRRGIRPLRAALAEFNGEAVYVRSTLERRFLQLCGDADLPPPAVNVAVAGYEVDMHWPKQRLVVELDTPMYHGARRAFESDRVKDLELQLAGQRVVRVTGRRLHREPGRVIGELRLLLAAT
jgi:Protein of unknown function (DUF559)